MKLKYYKFELNLVFMNVLAGILTLGFLITIPFVFGEKGTNLLIGGNFLIFYSLFMLYLCLHEICHGIGYALFAKNKKNIKFGAVLEKGVFYAMCQDVISKKGIIISLLFPIIFLTILPLPFCFIFDLPGLFILANLNLIGAIGDLTMLFFLFKVPNVSYIDYDNSIGMYLLSEEDLSNIKGIGVKCVESGKHTLDKVDRSIKRIYISKTSWLFLIIIFLILTINYLLSLI